MSTPTKKPAPRTGAELLVKSLEAQGVEYIFGIPGAKIDKVFAGGPGICTKHPHFFFGPLTPVEWAALMYQHLDHHVRQFVA